MKAVWSGFLGGITIISIICCILFYGKGYNHVPVMLVNHTIDSTVCSKIEVIHELEKKGIIITPQEYTNNISSFYNTIITVLVALFIIFSLVTYIHLKYVAEEQIQERLKKLLTTSFEVREVIQNTISGFVDEQYIKREDLESYVDEQIQNISRRIDNLDERFAEWLDNDMTITPNANINNDTDVNPEEQTNYSM